jgi:hypothetical protein
MRRSLDPLHDVGGRAVAVVLVVHRRAQYFHVGHDLLSSVGCARWDGPQPLVTIGAASSGRGPNRPHRSRCATPGRGARRSRGGTRRVGGGSGWCPYGFSLGPQGGVRVARHRRGLRRGARVSARPASVGTPREPSSWDTGQPEAAVTHGGARGTPSSAVSSGRPRRPARPRGCPGRPGPDRCDVRPGHGPRLVRMPPEWSGSPRSPAVRRFAQVEDEILQEQASVQNPHKWLMACGHP